MDGKTMKALRCLVAFCTVGCMLGFALPAMANAPNPIPSTTKVDGVSISNGQYTVTVEGQWSWATQTDCPTARNGVGYNVAWFDPSDTANPIGGNNSPNGVIDVGSPTDNMVHSIETLGGSSVTGNAFYNGLPSSYLTHNTTSSTPTQTDAKNWVSNCNDEDPSTKISTGTWGPISHTYPVGDSGPFEFCPVMYDPHGSGTSTGGNIGSSGVGDLISGGNGHNNDNSYEGNGQGVGGNNCSQLTIPALSTKASSAVSVGSPIADMATLNGSSPTGKITWNVYASSDASCATPLNAQPSTLTTSVSGNGTYSSPNFTPSNAGSYKWVATYSGDSNNASISTSCSDPAEVSTIGKASPKLVTNATSTTLGGTIQDSATLSGSFSGTGSITWNLYGPGDTTCATSIKTFTATVTGDGTYTSPTFTPTSAGSYRWIASYSGDGNNASTAGACNDPNETSTVNKTPPSLVTSATSGTVGGSIQDAATLSGGMSPTGTITWNLYGPGDTACSNAPLKTFTATVTGNGTYNSPTYTPATVGTYRWIASYSGDGNNLSTGGSCNDPNENSTVTPGTPGLTTNATSGTLGAPIRDVAHLIGGNSPTGTITWHVYAGSDSTCSTPLNTSALTATVTGDGDYTSPDFTPTAAGTYRWVATYSGDANNNQLSTACNDPAELSTVTKASPNLVTNATSATLGGTIQDSATLSGGVNPTGTITWNLYGPGDTSCATSIKTFTATVTGDGTYTSPTFTPASTGTYRWIASYSGDGNNLTTSGACNDPNESSTVNKTSPLLVTNATSATLGGTIQDSATLSGGSNPTGTITWNLYGPGDTACATSIQTFSAGVNGDGTYTSPTFTPSSAGTYRWIASYSGDGNNLSTAGHCNDPNESSTVTKVSPQLSTFASSTTVGGTIQDAAILTGGSNPTGTITWTLYGPGDTSCSSPIHTSSASVTGDGTYTSPTFTTSSAGTYRWIASYSGDGNNAAEAGACNDPNEASTVNPKSPSLVTSATSGSIGDSIDDVATLSGSFNATGTITWNLYGPGDTSCATSIQTFSKSVSGDGSYTSPSFTPSSAGTYRWIASYSGDGNNLSAAGSCNDPNETSTITKQVPVLTTNAVSAAGGKPIHDVAHLSGGHNPTGTISWNVYASSDAGCTTPLNGSALSVTVTGDGDYTSPNFTPSSPGSYQWVATYSGDTNNVKLATACGDPNEVSTVTLNAAPAITLHKVERIGSDPFTHGPVTGNVGDTVDYQIRVTNTGNTTLVIAFTDNECDGGTLSGPTVVSGSYNAATQTLSASGGELLYTCSHVLAAGDQPYTNTASVIGTPPTGPPVSATDSVKAFANVPGMRVVKLQRDGTSGPFTSNQITASVGDTIEYEIQVTNTGSTTLALSLSDPHCDAGTIQGPFAVSGTLNGNTLSAGGVAQYTCSHVVSAGDLPQFTNAATVTGQPPTGPPVHGTGIVVANITKAAIQVLKLEKDAGSSGGFTTGPINVNVGTPEHYVVHTIDYEIQVTNTGNVPLTLSLDDPRCDAGTIQGPAVITGTLNGDVLSPGGQAQYTCSHRLVKSDSATFTNTATVTGDPPSGPPVHGTSHVTVNKHSNPLPKKVCRSLTTGKVIHYKGHRKPKACRPQHGPPGHGFTG